MIKWNLFQGPKDASTSANQCDIYSINKRKGKNHMIILTVQKNHLTKFNFHSYKNSQQRWYRQNMHAKSPFVSNSL